jgi:glycosyltransferase involved in cell wall biosynthesis
VPDRNHHERPIRVTIVQPTLAAYRVPVFRMLAQTPDLSVRVVHASTPHLQNAPADGFDARFEPMTIRHVLGHPFYWQSSQLRYATPAECDVLVLNWDAHYLTLLPALLQARRNGVATVLWGHGYSRHTGGLRSLPRTSLANRADVLLFYNDRGARTYQSLGHDPSRLFVAYNSVDHSDIDAARAYWADRPAELDALRPQRADLLFVSRIEPARRVDVLLDALALLRDRNIHPTLALVGGGDLDPVRAQIARLHLADRVTLTGPIYDQQTLASYFLCAKLFCFPSFIGLSLQHAFAYALPVLAGNDPASHGPEFDALQDRINGRVFDHNSPTSLAAVIQELLTDEAQRSSLATAARSTIDTTYNLTRMTQGMSAAIRAAREQNKQ